MMKIISVFYNESELEVNFQFCFILCINHYLTLSPLHYESKQPVLSSQ